METTLFLGNRSATKLTNNVLQIFSSRTIIIFRFYLLSLAKDTQCNLLTKLFYFFLFSLSVLFLALLLRLLMYAIYAIIINTYTSLIIFILINYHLFYCYLHNLFLLYSPIHICLRILHCSLDFSLLKFGAIKDYFLGCILLSNRSFANLPDLHTYFSSKLHLITLISSLSMRS